MFFLRAVVDYGHNRYLLRLRSEHAVRRLSESFPLSEAGALMEFKGSFFESGEGSLHMVVADEPFDIASPRRGANKLADIGRKLGLCLAECR